MFVPEQTPEAFVEKAAGADTPHSISEKQISNKIHILTHNAINNPIAKLNGNRGLWNAIHYPKLRRGRGADSRARLRALWIAISVLTRIAIFRRVLAMKRTMRTKIFDPASSGSNDSWRALDWLAR